MNRYTWTDGSPFDYVNPSISFGTDNLPNYVHYYRTGAWGTWTGDRFEQGICQRWEGTMSPQHSHPVELDGLEIIPTLYGGASISADTITFADNMYASLSSSDLGTFGVGDFEIEAKVKANAAGSAAFPDTGTYGAFFIRSTEIAPPYTGPSSFLFSNGSVSFRMSSNTECRSSASTVSDWQMQQALRFRRTLTSGGCSTLQIFVNDFEVKSCNACESLTTSYFTSSEMWLATNHGTRPDQNLDFQITQLQLRTLSGTGSASPSPDPGPAPG